MVTHMLKHLLFGFLCLFPIALMFTNIGEVNNYFENFLPLHTFLETTSIILSAMIFGVGWISRKQRDSSSFIIASVFLLIAIFDFIHTISFTGMPAFINENNQNKDLWFWVTARFFAAFTLLIVSLPFLKIELSEYQSKKFLLFIVFLIISLSYLFIFEQQYLPDLFIQNIGLTPFKKNIEYICILLSFITAILFLFKKNNHITEDNYILFKASLLMGLTELFFTAYPTKYGIFNILGHIYKIIAYLYLYRSLVISVIESPYLKITNINKELDLSIKASKVGFFHWNLNNDTVFYSDIFLEQLGYKRNEVINNLNFLKSVINEECNINFQKDLNLYLNSNPPFNFEYEYKLKRKDKSIAYILLKGILTEEKNQKIFIGTHFDISDIKKNEDKIYSLANFDSLTGLANRPLLEKNIDNLIINYNSSNKSFVVLFIDLDHFKNVNDSLGHQIGDQVLYEVSQRILNILSNKNFVSRFGGDEFIVVILNDDLSEEQYIQYVKEKAFNIIESISKPYFINGNEITLTSSIGASLFPQNSTNFSELSKFADIAMYQAKNKGRNNFEFFNLEMNQLLTYNYKLQNHLHHAIIKNELFLCYQPQYEIINVSTPKLVGFEALIRWQNNELGNIPPNVFIPIAEKTGLIINIGNWIIEQACQQIEKWQKEKINLVPISINLSALQFNQSNFIDMLKQNLTKYDINPELIHIELTETIMMQEPERSKDVITEMNKLGLKLIIDDFGTGYSSLSYLKYFNIYQLKIDQSFIKNIHLNGADASIIKAIINLSKTLNFKVIAEGVETSEELEFLHQNGCEEIQGYLLGKPLLPNEAMSLMFHLE